MSEEKYIAIHGHFYQPPRENPWKNKIDIQDSAHPFSDWNERINRECYHPNGFSRILDEKGRIKEIVCNYKYINFNIGPTLLDWIVKHDNPLYKEIIEADKQSQEIFNGHGNAIAQVYNHIIMPLAIKKDRITQIRWGIEHFKYHFKRMPEAMWLAETAVNEDVLEDLVENKIKYIILSPTQVEKIKNFNNENWYDVSNNNIDTRRPYRIFLSKNKKLYIDVFFYNKDISTGISFNHYLRNAEFLAGRFFEQFSNNNEPEIVTACTDGESYGHHEHFGDMCLAYFLYKTINQTSYKIANFGQYLEMYPPSFEAVLKKGDNQEGTSWSCSHGVGRWIRDCGCQTGGEIGWNQKWRGPLRESFDYLRDVISVLYEEKLSVFFNDVWELRDKYIELIFDYSNENREKFLKKYCKPEKYSELTKEDKVMIFSFLLAEKNILLSYTSCAWFFSEISGIEAVQNMKYAEKAIYLVSSYTKVKLKENFLLRLEKCKSNLKGSYPKDGREIFNKYVEPDIIMIKDIVANYAIACALKQSDESMNIFYYNVSLVSYKKNKNEHIMEILIKDDFIGFSDIFYAYILYDSFKKITCFITSDKENAKYKKDSFLKKQSKQYNLSNLILDDRENLIKIAMKDKLDFIYDSVSKLYKDNKEVIDLFSNNEVDLPCIIDSITSYYITQKIDKKIQFSDSIDVTDLISQFNYAKNNYVKIDMKEVKETLYRVLLEEIEKLKEQESIVTCNKIIKLLKFKYKMKIELPTYFFEEKIFLMLKNKKYNKKSKFYKKLVELASYLNISV